MLHATHIVGGAFSLRLVSGNQYELTLKVLRDCYNGQAFFDEPATVGVFDKITHQMKASYKMELGNVETIKLNTPTCINDVPNQCTEIGYYKQMITLSPSLFNNTVGYYFSYQRCCRNDIINNLSNPQDAGIAIYLEVPSPALIKNSSPLFLANPNTFLCTGSETRYNFNFVDADGDELRYYLATPINGNLDRNNPRTNVPIEGPYANVTWASTYSTIRQINGSPDLQINQSTGELRVAPHTQGTYSVAIKVEEWRNGIKLGYVQLELQLSVIDCPQPLPRVIFKDENGNRIANVVEIPIPEKRCITIEATDPEDSLFMNVYTESADSPQTSVPIYTRAVSGNKEIVSTFCWQTSCDHTNLAPQHFTIEITDNGCPVANRVKATLVVKPIPMTIINPTDLLCMTLENNEKTILHWGDSTPNTPHFSHYRLFRSDESSFRLIDSVNNKMLRSYTDSKTPNYRVINYQYVMSGVNQCGIEGPPSDTLGTFEQVKSAPNKQYILTTTVIENTIVKVIWPSTTEKDFAQYLVYKKSTEDNEFKVAKTINNPKDTFFLDEDVLVNKLQYCYYVVMKDTCDNFSETGDKSCTILLSGNAEPFKHRLNWTAFTFWDEGTEYYEVFCKGDLDDGFASKGNTQLDTLFTDNYIDTKSGVFSYSVVAYNKKSPIVATGSFSNNKFSFQSQSNTIELSQKVHLFTPNAFTPNNDGINDVWNIRDIFAKEVHVQVYNKWGQLVFKTNDKNQKWDGTLNGNPVPSDVYTYRIYYSGYDGSFYDLSGNVTIIR
jgi:gliding motility-associated-like protein